MGHSETSVITSIHSHPGAEPDDYHEMYSMGFEFDPYTRTYNSYKQGSDYDLKTDPTSSFYNKSSYYIYMQKSHNLWQIKSSPKILPINKGIIKSSMGFPF